MQRHIFNQIKEIENEKSDNKYFEQQIIIEE